VVPPHVSDAAFRVATVKLICALAVPEPPVAVVKVVEPQNVVVGAVVPATVQLLRYSCNVSPTASGTELVKVRARVVGVEPVVVPTTSAAETDALETVAVECSTGCAVIVPPVVTVARAVRVAKSLACAVEGGVATPEGRVTPQAVSLVRVAVAISSTIVASAWPVLVASPASMAAKVLVPQVPETLAGVPAATAQEGSTSEILSVATMSREDLKLKVTAPG